MDKKKKENTATVAVTGIAFQQALEMRQKAELKNKQVYGIATIVKEAIAEKYKRELGDEADK